MKKFLLSSLALVSVGAFANGCENAKQFLIEAASQIKLNHQGIEGFNIYNQEEIINMDRNIIYDVNYQENLNFVKNNCKI